MSPRAPITTGIVSVFIPHILVVSISRSLYLGSFSVVFKEVFQCDVTAISMSLQVLFLWSLITNYIYQACYLLFLYLCVFAYPKVS